MNIDVDLRNKIVMSEKRAVLSALATKFSVNVFVETGTYYGDTSAYMAEFVSEIHSIELSEQLARLAQKKFALNSKVHIHQGDSGAVLSEVMNSLKERALVFLDAHYSRDETARGSKDSPLIEELRCFQGLTIRDHIIVIDNLLDCFAGLKDYPTIGQVIDEISKINRAYVISVKDDFLSAIT